ncbi:MAG: L,D-transpeptidase family protein [Inquilinus limosus]|uniref:L,D-transpeptidase family protein n=1 Tax=Inquilinus limosus TaxID=171674 RepID=A0A952KLP4_9PROT|nr:L,D-transpeptidase family protein [Inquilinus limosus]
MTACSKSAPYRRGPIARAALAVASILVLAACVPAGTQQTASLPTPEQPAPPPLSPFVQAMRDAGVNVAIPARGKFILVNIPSYELIAFQDGAPVLRSKVVVGAAGTSTPELLSNMYAIKYNPDWTPTPSIVRNEASVYIPSGPRSPLGRLKLELDNDQAIYLHDTPQKSYFGRDKRALSHGCVRVQQVRELAAWADGVSVDEIDRKIRTGRMYTERLPEEIPVYIGYFTRFPDEFNQPVDHPDVYANKDAARQAYLARTAGRRAAAAKKAAEPPAQPPAEIIPGQTGPATPGGETTMPPATVPGETPPATPAQPAAPATTAPAAPAVPAAPVETPAVPAAPAVTEPAAPAAPATTLPVAPAAPATTPPAAPTTN